MSLRTVLIIFRKELKDTLRDKRAFFISVIFPVVLFPLIFSVLDMNIQKANKKIKGNMEIGLEETGGSVIRDFLSSRERFIIKENSLNEKLETGEIYAVVKAVSEKDKIDITVVFDNSRQQSLTAAAELTALFKALSDSMNRNSIRNAELQNIIINQTTLFSSSKGNSMLILSTLLPFLMFVFAALSPVALASDTGAGEKERFTLEPLLANPVSKTEILAGKYLCLVAMGLTGTLAFSAGIIISTVLTPEVFGFENFNIYITPASAALLFLTAVILTMLFSAAELTLSLAAKSPKEAQIFFLPLMMITMTAGYSTSVIDPLNIDTIFRHIPLFNISILIKEFSLNKIDPFYSVLTFIWTFLFIALLLFISKILISGESIVKRE